MTEPMLAWNLGFAQDGELIPALGLCIDQDGMGGGSTIGGVLPTVLSFFGRRGGGPLYVPESAGEKHFMPGTAATTKFSEDGQLQTAGHLSTCSHFKTFGGGSLYDAPLGFRLDPFIPTVELPFPLMTKLLYNPGAKHKFLDREVPGIWDWVTFYDFGGSHDGPGGSGSGDEGTSPGGGGGGTGSGGGGGSVETETKPKPPESRVPPEEDEEIFCDLISAREKKIEKKEEKKKTPPVKRYTPGEDRGLFKAYRYTPYHFAFSGIYAKGNPSVIDSEFSKDFSEYTKATNKEDLDKWRDSAPISGILLSYASSNDDPFYSNYTEPPQDFGSTFFSGSAPGGFLFMPPEISLYDIREINEGTTSLPPRYTSGKFSGSGMGIAPRMRHYHGWPDLRDGTVYQGWSSLYDDSTDKFQWYYHKANTPPPVLQAEWDSTLFDFKFNLQAKNIKRGTGTPESNVVGTIGDIYMRTDSPNGNLYFKETGINTNTGWIDINAGLGGGGSSVWTDTGAAGEVYYSNTDRDLVFGAVDAEVTSGLVFKTFFDISKGTFVAGRITTALNDVSRGSYSVAFGDRPETSGDYNIVAGQQNEASGNHSAVFGDNNTLQSTASHCFIAGDGNLTGRDYTYLLGFQNTTAGTINGFNMLVGTSNSLGATNTGGNNYIFGSNVDITQRGDLCLLHGVNSSVNNTGSGQGNIVFLGIENSSVDDCSYMLMSGLTVTADTSTFTTVIGNDIQADGTDYSFFHGQGHSIIQNANHCYALGKEAKPQFDGHIAFSNTGAITSGTRQRGLTVLDGVTNSGAGTVELTLNGAPWILPSAPRVYSLMVKVTCRSTTTSITNANKIFVERTELDVNIVAGTASIVGTPVVHYTNDEFAGGVSVAYSITAPRRVAIKVTKAVDYVLNITASVDLVEVETI